VKDELLSMRFLEVIHPDFQNRGRIYALSLLRDEQAESMIENKVVGKAGG